MNKNWLPGDSITTPNFNMQSINVDELSKKDAYKLMISAITPRPIAFISSQNSKGELNLSPFSFFNGVGTSPPAVMFSIVPKSNGEKKDTLKNILETKEFVINGASQWMLGPLHHSSAEYPHGESEISKMGLSTLPSLKVSPPRIQGTAWQFECKLYNTLTVGDGGVGSGTIVVGEIVQFHVANECLTNGTIDFEKLSPLARIGGAQYAYDSKTVSMPPAQTPKKE